MRNLTAPTNPRFASGARQQGKAAKKHRSAALSAADGSRAKSASPPPAEERPTGPAGPPPALLQQVYAALREQHDAGLHPDWALGPAPRSGSTSTAQSFHVARITTGMAVRVDVEQSNLDGGECCGYVVALFRAGVFNTVDTSSWGDMPARLASYHDLEAVLHRIAAARCCPGVEDDGGVRACSALRNHAWPGAAVQTDTVLGPAGLLSWCVRHDSCPLLLAPGAACCVDCRRLKHYCLQVRQQAAAAATHGL